MRRVIQELTAPYLPETVAEGAITVQKSPSSALPSMLVKRGRERVATYLISHQVLMMAMEEDRAAATAALAASGFTVREPLWTCMPGEALMRMGVSAVGAWGNILVFDLAFPHPRNNARVGLYDLDDRGLCVVSEELLPHATRILALMGLSPAAVSPAAISPELREKLEWREEMWGWSPIHDGPAFRVPAEQHDSIIRELVPDAAARVPQEVARAVNEVFAVPVKDPFHVMNPVPGYANAEGFWSAQHGVLDGRDLAKLRDVAPQRVLSLPGDWREHWDRAMVLSPSHAPSLTALTLHDAHPDWWQRLRTSGVREQLHGIWLLGHNDKKPAWMRTDTTNVEEDRFGVAVAAVVTMIKELDWLVPASLVPQDCALCGRPFTPAKLAAGHVAQLRTADVCHLCVRLGSVDPSRIRTPVLKAGTAAAVGEVVRYAGRVISASMVSELLVEGSIDPITMILLQQVLPAATEAGWVKWLAASGALGNGWRPARGYISVAADGHECRSAFERIIDDFLWANKIPHEIEPIYPYDAELNEHGSRADWLLPGGIFVEAAGLMSQREYAEKMARKTELATKHGIQLLILTEADLPRLQELFAVVTS